MTGPQFRKIGAAARTDTSQHAAEWPEVALFDVGGRTMHASLAAGLTVGKISAPLDDGTNVGAVNLVLRLPGDELGVFLPIAPDVARGVAESILKQVADIESGEWEVAVAQDEAREAPKQ